MGYIFMIAAILILLVIDDKLFEAAQSAEVKVSQKLKDT